jgi:hypothetical protein
LPKYIIPLFLLLCAFPLAALSPYNALGDTLTVIMRPILNVPTIQVPGETFTITCLAPQSTTNWQAYLLHNSRSVTMSVTSSQYLTSPNRWELQALVPQVPVFELYDLKVTASGGINDTTQNAVQIVPTRKTDYYFIHVTDLHLPTRIYYPDSGFDSDSTSVNDFRSVIDDINIINPEFVLLTGDLINEGELEGFMNQYWYGWSQRLLQELQVPCYVTAGNHDIGGWNSTPPSQGSSRRSWWRYYGWPWLDNASTSWHQHTQDYDFTYGDLQFIGMEAYDNYDSFRYNIYNYNSFIPDQMTWLNSTLSLHPDKTKVMFYHYDYQDQLNLSTLGVDMGLWGHIHYNSGSVSSFPYNLATRSVCDGNRAYRVIRVNGSSLQPLNTIYAGSSGTNLTIAYSPANNGVSDHCTATLANSQSVAFENALVKFRLQPGNYGYTVTNGTLLQVDRGETSNFCYVQVNLPAQTTRAVTIAVDTSPADDPAQTPAPLITAVYPNPFSSELSILMDSRQTLPDVSVYNTRGELIRRLEAESNADTIIWDGRDADGNILPPGVYLLRAHSGKKSEQRRIVKY